MQGEPPGWDARSVYYSFDLTTKFTVMYLMISAVVFLVLAIRFLPILWRFRASVVLLRTQNTLKADSDGQRVNAENPARHQFRGASASIEAALMALRRWVQLTALILVAYSATEIADLLRGISATKMTGISALSGGLAQIVSMCVVALWLIVALSIADWILSRRLMRCADLQVDSLR